MFNELEKIGVFLKRDFRMLYTYKIAFLITFLNMVITFFYLVLFGGMFAVNQVSALEPYGGNFISFILIGSIGWGFLWNVLNTTSFSLRNEMVMGTLESVLLTPTKIYTMMIAYALFGCFFGLLSMAILFLIGIGFFGLSAFESSSIYTIVIFFLSATMMLGIGMIFSGLTIWYKHIGQTLPLIQGITMIFSGVYFPINQLPPILQPVPKIIPFYYSMEGLRLSLIPTTPTSEILKIIIILLILTISFLIIGLYSINRGLKNAKREGSLAFY